MTKLSESLIILNFIGLKIESLFNHFINYGFSDLQTGIKKDLWRKLFNLGIDEHTLNSEVYKSFINKESSLIFSLLHENFSKGIIDLYSFKQEYDSFFNTKFDDDAINNRILNFKENNRSRINEIDWNEIKDLRNTILAHNLRSKKENYSIANDCINKFVNLSLDFKKGLLYFTLMNMLYNNLKEEFATELQTAFRESILDR